jgi:hypothetical protein
MARAFAILRALGRAYSRDWTALQSLGGNNFLLIVALLMGKAGTFVYLIMGLVLLFPLSTDPLRKIPPSRLALWPLERRERWALRLVSPWLNPLTWGIVALAVWGAGRTLTYGLWATLAGLFAGAFLLSAVPLPKAKGAWRAMPQFPGPLNQLIRKNLREIFTTLDFYTALALSAAVAAYRLFGPPLPPDAFMAMTVLVIGALSGYAQCLFGLDGDGGLSRCRLLPVHGWQLLLAKDAAFLAAAIPLTLPLGIATGLGAALVALAIGHEPSVARPREQTRWRFTTGGALGNSALQMVGIGMTASLISRTSPWFFFAALLLWALSLWWYGRDVERVLQ